MKASMVVDTFDEGLEHRNILPCDPTYSDVFARVQRYVHENLESVELVHIGSTAIRDLRGKPMVDIAAITSRENLRTAQEEFERLGFHRRAVWVDKDEKPYERVSNPGGLLRSVTTRRGLNDQARNHSTRTSSGGGSTENVSGGCVR